MDEIIFYLVCLVLLAGWVFYQIKKHEHEQYIDWVDDLRDRY